MPRTRCLALRYAMFSNARGPTRVGTKRRVALRDSRGLCGTPGVLLLTVPAPTNLRAAPVNLHIAPDNLRIAPHCSALAYHDTEMASAHKHDTI